jgi:catechol 2,3-dioxygenase-like lactoylglutathione lyase family enzyme
MKIHGVNVVFVYVQDMQVSRAFYSDILNLGTPQLDTPTWIEWKLAKGANFAIHKASDEMLEGIVPARSSVKFSLVVEDIREAYKFLFEKGVRVASEPRDGAGFLYLEFQDPDGNVLRLIQFLKK